jgi:hypothetical protein
VSKFIRFERYVVPVAKKRVSRTYDYYDYVERPFDYVFEEVTCQFLDDGSFSAGFIDTTTVIDGSEIGTERRFGIDEALCPTRADADMLSPELISETIIYQCLSDGYDRESCPIDEYVQ